MPVIIGLAPEVVLGALVLIGLAYTLPQWHEPQTSGILSVLTLPTRLLMRGVNAATRATQNAIDTWVNAKAQAVTAWLYAVGSVIGALPIELAHFSSRIVAGIDHLTHVTMHEVIKAFTSPIYNLIGNIDARLEVASHTASLAFGHASDAFTYTNRLVSDVVWPQIERIETRLIPEVAARVSTLETEAGQFAANFAQLEAAHLIKTVGAIEAELPDIRSVTNVLSKVTDLAALAAVGTIAVDLVRWYKKCNPSKACFSNSTSTDLDSLFAAVLPAIEGASFLALLDGMQKEMQGVSEFMTKFAGV